MHIYTIGSLNLDFVYTVEHFLRPGETLHSLKREVFPGGKGLNQSIALARAGASVFHAGCIGEDGFFLRETLEQAGVDCSLIRIVPEPTGHAIIQVEPSGENCILLFAGANQAFSSESIQDILSSCQKGDILLLQNEINGLEEILKTAAEKGLAVALNPSPWEDSLKKLPLEAVRWFLVNQLEGEGFTGEKEPERIARALRGCYPKADVILTLGANGVYYCGEKEISLPAFLVKAIDSTAAGDTFTGYFLASIQKGLPIRSALQRASLAASIAVTRKGASPSIPFLEEVLQAERSMMP